MFLEVECLLFVLQVGGDGLAVDTVNTKVKLFLRCLPWITFLFILKFPAVSSVTPTVLFHRASTNLGSVFDGE